MAIIGFDIDDTIADGSSVFIPAQNLYFNKNIAIHDLNTARLHELYDVSEIEMHKYILDSAPKLLPQLLPIQDAQNMVNSFYEAGHTIHFVTARPKSSCEELTKEWLKNFGFKYHGLFFSETKVEICKQLEIEIFVDDHFRVIENVHAVGIKSIFVDDLKNKKITTSPGIFREESPRFIKNRIDVLLENTK